MRHAPGRVKARHEARSLPDTIAAAMTEQGRFIATIAALVYHPPTRSYLLLRRSSAVEVNTGDWETVTGRLQHGESFEEGARREVFEEIGAAVELDFILGTAHFFRGNPSDENEALGVRYACTVADQDSIRLSPEHDSHLWVTPEEAASFLGPDHRVSRMIQRAEIVRAGLSADVVSLHRREGFLSD